VTLSRSINHRGKKENHEVIDVSAPLLPIAGLFIKQSDETGSSESFDPTPRSKGHKTA